MKKYVLVALCAVAVLSLTGCGKKNQVKCSMTESSMGMEMKANVVAELDKDNKVTKVSESLEFGDKETADAMCSLAKLSGEEGIKCSGKTITMDSADELDDVVGKTKDEFVEAAKANGFTCE